MCQFCTQHGDGEVWYLQAKNYIADLESDLSRRDYIIDFVQEFDTTRSSAITWLNQLEKSAPERAGKVLRRRFEKRQMQNHFGQPVPIEECDRIFDFATSIVRLPCVCRAYSGKVERGYCLAVTAMPMDDVLEEAFKGYEMGPDLSGLERLTKDEAMALLHRCEREGLMHSVWTFQTPFIGAVCNCDLESGCMAMTLTLEHDMKTMWRGEWVAAFDEEKCTQCGACASRCPFDALEWDRKERRITYRAEDCFGCGVCRSACKPDALTLVKRGEVPAVAEVW